MLDSHVSRSRCTPCPVPSSSPGCVLGRPGGCSGNGGSHTQWPSSAATRKRRSSHRLGSVTHMLRNRRRGLPHECGFFWNAAWARRCRHQCERQPCLGSQPPVMPGLPCPGATTSIQPEAQPQHAHLVRHVHFVFFPFFLLSIPLATIPTRPTITVFFFLLW